MLRNLLFLAAVMFAYGEALRTSTGLKLTKTCVTADWCNFDGDETCCEKHREDGN